MTQTTQNQNQPSVMDAMKNSIDILKQLNALGSSVSKGDRVPQKVGHLSADTVNKAVEVTAAGAETVV